MSKKQDQPVKEEEHDNTTPVYDFIHESVPYITQLFHAGLAGREGLRLSIQCTPNGTFKGSLAVGVELGTHREHGLVSYTDQESFGQVFDYFELGLSYGVLSWKPDKYFKGTHEEGLKIPKSAVKVALEA